MHAYWLTSDTPLEQFKSLQQALIQLFDSDAKVHDLPRVMRLPGTLHLKGAPVLVKMWAREPGPVYETQRIVNAYGLDKRASGGERMLTSANDTAGAHPEDQSELLNKEPLDALDDMSAGIDRGWFDKLGDKKDEALRQMLDVLPDIALGGRAPWLECLMAAHSSGAPHTEDIARDWSMLGGDKYSDAEFDKAWGSVTDKPGGISIGTLIKLATERGIDPATGKVFDAHAWRAYVDALQLAAQTGTPPPAAPTPSSSLPRAPMVGGKMLLSTLPPQTLQDVPGNKAQIMEALDRRLAADPYTFHNSDRLISLRVSPGAAVLFPHMVDRDASGSTPAVVDDGDMPIMLETTDADVLYLADQDHWLGYSPGRVAEGEKPRLRRVHAPADTCKLYMRLSRAKIGVRPLLGLARVPIIDDAGNLDFTEGYHEATGIFRDRTPLFELPDNPTGATAARRSRRS